MTQSEAISEFVHDADVLYMAGFTQSIPFAAAHEIIRQGKKNLTLCRATPDLIYDQMIAAGCARKVIFSFAGNPGVGSLRVFRKAVEEGVLEIEEYTHFGIVSRLFAGAIGLPFMPLRTNLGTDLPKNNANLKTIVCPFSGSVLSAVPALRPDVTIIHCQRTDEDGNAHIWGILGEVKEAAFAGRTVVLIAEEIVDREVIRSDPNRTVIPGFIVTAVVEEPWGAHPSYVQGYYDRDNAFYIEWDKISADEGLLKRYLDEWIYGVHDRREYMAKLGAERMMQLRGRTWYSVPTDYGLYK